MAEEWRREHEWDMLRSLLMVLGIPYHASMAYNTNILWDIHSPDTSAVLTFFSGLLVTFRMPAFFMVAGYFAVMMLARRPVGTWLANRYLRLGVPFLTSLVLLIPPQLILIRVAEALNGRTSLEDALTQAGTDLAHPSAEWIMHLWFLPSLIVCCTILALIVGLGRKPTIHNAMLRSRHWLENRRDALFFILFALLAVWELTLRAAYIELIRLGPGLPEIIARGLDPYLRYLPYFFIGALIRHEPAMHHAFRMPKGWVMPVAAFLVATIAAFTRASGIEVLDLVNSFATGTAALMASRLLIGYARRHWCRQNALIDRVVDASFTIYLLHHPIIYGLATAFLLVSWPPLVEFAVIGVTAGLLSYGAHRLIRRRPVALFLMNGVLPRTKESQSTDAGGTLH